jgi:hypothetical protein
MITLPYGGLLTFLLRNALWMMMSRRVEPSDKLIALLQFMSEDK